MGNKRAIAASTAILMAGAAPQAVLAQEQTSAQAAATATATQTNESEILVTAERRTERLEEVPMALVAVPAVTLANANITGVQELGRVASGVQINFGGISTQTAIRGVTTLTNGYGVENNIGVYIDGFYEPSSTFINQDFSNVSSVEVLKGPQGTLYGRNATGGAILINTLTPSETLKGNLEVSYGRFDDKIAKGYISGPLAKSLRFSLAGYFRNSDGYIRLTDPNIIGKKAGNAAPIRQRSIRAKIEADLSDSLTATIGYNYGLASDARGQLFTTFDYVNPALPAPPAKATEPGTASYNFDNVVRNRAHQGTLKLVLDTGIGDLASYTAYQAQRGASRFDFDGTYTNISYTSVAYDQRTFQTGLDYAIDAINNVDLLIGVFYYRDHYGGDPEVGQSSYSNGRLFARYDQDLRTRSIAGFVDATWHATDKLAISLGGRYTTEKKELSLTNFNGLGIYTLSPKTRDVTWKKATPRASIRYEVAPRTNIYATYSTGFRGGTYNLSSGVTDALLARNPILLDPTKPETIKSYEVGLKSAGRMLRFDVAGYYYDYKNLNATLTVENPTCAGTVGCPIAQVFGNAKSAEVYGIDGEVSLTPLEGLNIRAGAAWIHARYKDFKNAVGVEINPLTGLNVTGRTQDWSGQQTARAPNFSGNVGFDYKFVLKDADTILISSNVNYTDSYVVSNPSLFCSATCSGGLVAKQRFRTGPYALVSAQITWSDPSDHYYVGVWGKNLADSHYRATFNGGFYGDYYTLGEPVTYGLRLGTKF